MNESRHTHTKKQQKKIKNKIKTRPRSWPRARIGNKKIKIKKFQLREKTTRMNLMNLEIVGQKH